MGITQSVSECQTHPGLHALCEQIERLTQSLRSQLDEVKEQTESRQRFALLKLYPLLDYWECSFLEQINEFFLGLEQALDSLQSQVADLQQKDQQFRRLDIIDRSKTLSEQIDALATRLKVSNAVHIRQEFDGLMSRMRLCLPGTSPEQDVLTLTKIYRSCRHKSDEESCRMLASFFEQLGVEVHFTNSPRSLPSLKSLKLLVLEDKTNFETLLIRVRPTIQLFGQISGSTEVCYLILCGPPSSTELIRSLKDHLDHQGVAHLQQLVAELGNTLYHYLCMACRRTRELSREAFTLLNKLNEEYHKDRTCESLGDLLRLWYRFVTDVLDLEVLPSLPVQRPQQPIVGLDVLRKLETIAIHKEYDHQSPSPAGTLTSFNAFWCADFSSEREITWFLSTGQCPQRIVRAATLSLEGLQSDELKEHVNAVRELLIDPSRSREVKFNEICDKLKKTIEQCSKGGHLARDLNKLFKAAAGFERNPLLTKDQAEAWVDHLYRDLDLSFDPTIPQKGEYPRCNTKLWQSWLDRHRLTPQLPPGVHVSEGSDDDAPPKGYVLDCRFASVNPDCVEYEVSLGPMKGTPRSVLLARELLKASSNDRVGVFHIFFNNLFRREAFYFLTNRQSPRWSRQEIEEVLTFLFGLREEDEAKASQLFSECRAIFQESGWSIEPQEYNLGNRYGDLIGLLREAVDEYDPDETHPIGYITPWIREVDDSNRTIRLGLRVSVGQPFRCFREIEEILRSHPDLHSLLPTLESIPRRIREMYSGQDVDPREIWIRGAIDFYEKFTDEFPEKLEGCKQHSPSPELEKAVQELRRKVEESLTSLGLRFWQPQTMEEARDSRRVNAVGDVLAPTGFDVLRRGVILGDQLRLSSKIRWYRRNES